MDLGVCTCVQNTLELRRLMNCRPGTQAGDTRHLKKAEVLLPSSVQLARNQAAFRHDLETLVDMINKESEALQCTGLHCSVAMEQIANPDSLHSVVESLASEIDSLRKAGFTKIQRLLVQGLDDPLQEHSVFGHHEQKEMRLNFMTKLAEKAKVTPYIDLSKELLASTAILVETAVEVQLDVMPDGTQVQQVVVAEGMIDTNRPADVTVHHLPLPNEGEDATAFRITASSIEGPETEPPSGDGSPSLILTNISSFNTGLALVNGIRLPAVRPGHDLLVFFNIGGLTKAHHKQIYGGAFGSEESLEMIINLNGSDVCPLGPRGKLVGTV